MRELTGSSGGAGIISLSANGDFVRTSKIAEEVDNLSSVTN